MIRTTDEGTNHDYSRIFDCIIKGNLIKGDPNMSDVTNTLTREHITGRRIARRSANCFAQFADKCPYNR